jgi:hypothetical protein
MHPHRHQQLQPTHTTTPSQGPLTLSTIAAPVLPLPAAPLISPASRWLMVAATAAGLLALTMASSMVVRLVLYAPSSPRLAQVPLGHSASSEGLSCRDDCARHRCSEQ